MSVVLSGDRHCLVCGRPSLLTVHRKCSRKFVSARAGFLAARGAGVASPSAKVATPASSFGSSSCIASLLDKPRGDDPMSSGQSMRVRSQAPRATPPQGGA